MTATGFGASNVKPSAVGIMAEKIGLRTIANGPSVTSTVAGVGAPYGSVTVTSDHRAVKVIDHSCYDVLDVAAQYKYQAGGTVYTGGTGAGAHTCGDTIVHPTPGPIVSFRNCLRDGGTVSESDCGDWFSP